MSSKKHKLKRPKNQMAKSKLNSKWLSTRKLCQPVSKKSTVDT